MRSLLGIVALALPTSAFMPKAQWGSRSWELREVILGEEVVLEKVDLGQGGVRLAEESAIKIVGDVKHKPGKANAQPSELLRYNNLKSIDEAKAKDVLSKSGCKIISTGSGVELYKDPGDTVEKFVQYGPIEAAKDAVNGAASAIDCEKLVFNFLGGDDLMMGEVLDAANEMVVDMDVATKAKVSFNSLCHSSIPATRCTVTVVALGNEEGEFSGAEKSIANGEVYVIDGAWWTVDEADLNKALE